MTKTFAEKAHAVIDGLGVGQEYIKGVVGDVGKDKDVVEARGLISIMPRALGIEPQVMFAATATALLQQAVAMKIATDAIGLPAEGKRRRDLERSVLPIIEAALNKYKALIDQFDALDADEKAAATGKSPVATAV